MAVGARIPDEKPKSARTDRWADRLTVLILVATGATAILYLTIAIDPTIGLNPYPPPTLFPSATPTGTREPSTWTPPPVTGESTRSTEVAFLSPTPMRPVTLTPTPAPAMPFSATVELDRGLSTPDCTQPMVAGRVLDAEGEDLMGYPVHVWGAGLDTIVLSGSAPAWGPSGWEVAASVEETEGAQGGGAVAFTWYVQLHRYDAYRTHPPLSDIVRVNTSESCPQATILFQERP